MDAPQLSFDLRIKPTKSMYKVGERLAKIVSEWVTVERVNSGFQLSVPGATPGLDTPLFKNAKDAVAFMIEVARAKGVTPGQIREAANYARNTVPTSGLPLWKHDALWTLVHPDDRPKARRKT